MCVCVFPQFLSYGHRWGGVIIHTANRLFYRFSLGNGIFVFIKLRGRNNAYLNTHVVFKLPASTTAVPRSVHTRYYAVLPCVCSTFVKRRGPFRVTSRRPRTVYTFCGLTGLSSFSFLRVLSSDSDLDPFFYRPASPGTFTTAQCTARAQPKP